MAGEVENISPFVFRALLFYLKFLATKGQIILECPYEKNVYPKIATKKFPRFLSWPLRRGQIKKIKALYYTN